MASNDSLESLRHEAEAVSTSRLDELARVAERLAQRLPPYSARPTDSELATRRAVARLFLQANATWQAMRVLGPVAAFDGDNTYESWRHAFNASSFRLATGHPAGALLPAAIALRRLTAIGSTYQREHVATWSLISRIWADAGLRSFALGAASVADSLAAPLSDAQISLGVLDAFIEAETRSDNPEAASIDGLLSRFSRWLAAAPDDSQAPVGSHHSSAVLGRFLLASDRHADAARVVQSVLDRFPTRAPHPLNAILPAIVHLGHGRHDAARPMLHEAIRSPLLNDFLRSLSYQLLAIASDERDESAARKERTASSDQQISVRIEQLCAHIELETELDPTSWSARVLDDSAALASLRRRPQGDATLVGGVLAQALAASETETFSGISARQAGMIGRLCWIGDFFVPSDRLRNVVASSPWFAYRWKHGGDLVRTAAAYAPDLAPVVDAFSPTDTPARRLCEAVALLLDQLHRYTDDDLFEQAGLAYASTLAGVLGCRESPEAFVHSLAAFRPRGDLQLAQAAAAHLQLHRALVARHTSVPLPA